MILNNCLGISTAAMNGRNHRMILPEIMMMVLVVNTLLFVKIRMERWSFLKQRGKELSTEFGHRRLMMTLLTFILTRKVNPDILLNLVTYFLAKYFLL